MLSQKHIPRLYLKEGLRRDQKILVPEGKLHHLKTVLRMKSGDLVKVFNGRDGEWSAQIDQIDRRTMSLICTSQLRPQTTCTSQIHLCYSPLKREPEHFLIEKCCELGVDHLRPILFKRTQGHGNSQDQHVKQLEKTSRICCDASEQSNRINVPNVHTPLTLENFLTQIGKQKEEKESSKNLFILCDEALEQPTSTILNHADELNSSKNIFIFIGPEGGLCDQDRHTFKTHLASSGNLKNCALSNLTLRAETAAITALSHLWIALNFR